MANDLEDIGRKMQDLTARSLSAQVNAARRYTELIGRLGPGELITRAVGDDYVRFARDETARYVSNLATLSLDYYGSVIELGRAYNDRFFEQVLGNKAAASARGTDRVEEVPPRRVELEIHAPLGQEAVRSFTLENRQAETVEVSFLVSDFEGPAGTAAFRVPLEFQPPRFTLDPGEARVVTMRLSLTPPRFNAGERYTTTVVVRGYDGLELVLGVCVDSPSAPSDASARSSAPAERKTRRAKPRK